jgi:hypothetical protein
LIAVISIGSFLCPGRPSRNDVSLHPWRRIGRALHDRAVPANRTTVLRLESRAVADSLAEAGERLFTFLRYPPEQWRSLRTTNAIERLREQFKRRINTQCLLPCAETAAMLFGALLASGQITMRRVDLAHPRPLTDRS